MGGMQLVFAFLALAFPGSGHALPSPVPPPAPIALVTAERQDALLAVSPRTGRVLRRVTLADDPENVAASASVAVVVSARGHTVTVLHPRSLRQVARLSDFGFPHIVSLSPDSKWAYVTDDAQGELDVVELAGARIVARLAVGAGAHHMALSPDGRRLWIALGEDAATIVRVDVTDPLRPRVTGRLRPPYAVHDLAFGPNGESVWLTGAKVSLVHVLAASTGRLRFTVPAGAAPQHVRWGGGDAYVTSGYGGLIERVDPNGHVLARARLPVGSFNLAVGAGMVVVSSLFTGTMTELTPALTRLHTSTVADAARAVALVPPR